MLIIYSNVCRKQNCLSYSIGWFLLVVVFDKKYSVAWVSHDHGCGMLG